MKKLILASLAVAASCCFGDFAMYVDVTIQNFSGSAVNEDLPVLVRINNSKIPGFFTAVKNNGVDLKFTDENGQGDYPYEIDTWTNDVNSAADTLIWVKLPSFSSSTKFRMYYGDEDVTSHSWASTDVWTGYDLVCHINDSAKDSSVHDVLGVINPNSTRVAAGKIGACYGTSNNGMGSVFSSFLFNGEVANARADISDPVFSASCWFTYNLDPSTHDWWRVVGVSGGWGLNTIGANSYRGLQVNTGSHNFTPYLSSGSIPLDGSWFKVDVVYNSNTMTLYVDGQLIGSQTLGSVAQVCYHTWIGWGGTSYGTTETPNFNNPSCCAMNVDECRVHGSAISAERVAACYAIENGDVCLFSEPQEPPKVIFKPNGIRIY